MLHNNKILQIKNRRVVNGLTAQESWNWLVRLEFLVDGSDLSSLCGGTVIHRYFILTAAHCCIGKNSVVMYFKETISIKNTQNSSPNLRVKSKDQFSKVKIKDTLNSHLSHIRLSYFLSFLDT